MKYFSFLLIIFSIICISCEQENQTNEKSPSTMNGTEMTYQYSEGNAYNLKFENDSVSYRFLSGPKPTIWWGPFKNNVTLKENNEYILSWYEHGYGDYITLIINADRKTLWGSGVVVKGDKSHVHFQEAEISEFVQNLGE